MDDCSILNNQQLSCQVDDDDDDDAADHNGQKSCSIFVQQHRQKDLLNNIHNLFEAMMPRVRRKIQLVAWIML